MRISTRRKSESATPRPAGGQPRGGAFAYGVLMLLSMENVSTQSDVAALLLASPL